MSVNYHTLLKDDVLYRGNGWNESDGIIQPFPTYFGFNKQHVKQYGRVHTYKVMEPMRLFSADNITESFYNKAPKAIQKIMNQNFGYKSHIRDSESAQDKEFLNYLCNSGYDGYAIKSDMLTPNGDAFHHEVAICEPLNKIKYISTDFMTPKEQEIAREKQMEIKLKKKLKSQRKPNKQRMRYEDDDEHYGEIPSNPLPNPFLSPTPAPMPVLSSPSIYDSPPSKKQLFQHEFHSPKGGNNRKITKKYSNKYNKKYNKTINKTIKKISKKNSKKSIKKSNKKSKQNNKRKTRKINK